MDPKMLEIWNTPFFGEKFAKFYKLLLKAEDQDEIDQLKVTTEYERKMMQLFRSKSEIKASPPLGEDEEPPMGCTPPGIYAGSIASDNVFMDSPQQENYYEEPEWVRYKPHGPKDLNFDPMYQSRVFHKCKFSISPCLTCLTVA